MSRKGKHVGNVRSNARVGPRDLVILVFAECPQAGKKRQRLQRLTSCNYLNRVIHNVLTRRSQVPAPDSD